MARRRKRGTGAIFERTNGHWTGQITITSKGGRVRRSYTSRHKGDVEFWLREAARSVRAGDEPSDTKRTVGDHLEDWLAEVGHSVRPTTARGYRIHVERWIIPVIGEVPLVDVGPAHVRRVRDGVIRKGKSPRTAQAVLLTLRMALGQAVRDGLVPRNAADGVKSPRQAARRIVATSAADARAILAAFEEHRLGPLVTVAMGSGLRLGELLGLRWSDITGPVLRVSGSVRPVPREDGRGYMIRHSIEVKTRRSIRALELPGFAIAALDVERRRQAEEGVISPFVFVTAGRREHAGEAMLLDPKNVTRSFQAQLERSKLPKMRFHDLRHAYATLMLAAGVPLRVIAEALGHTSVATTATVYAHVLPELQHDAAARLDEAISGP